MTSVRFNDVCTCEHVRGHHKFGTDICINCDCTTFTSATFILPKKSAKEAQSFQDELDRARRIHEDTRVWLWISRIGCVALVFFVALCSKSVMYTVFAIIMSLIALSVMSYINKQAKLEHQEAAQSYLYWMVRDD